MKKETGSFVDLNNVLYGDTIMLIVVGFFVRYFLSKLTSIFNKQKEFMTEAQIKELIDDKIESSLSSINMKLELITKTLDSITKISVRE